MHHTPTTSTASGRHAGAARRPAVPSSGRRTAVLVLAVLLVQLAFIGSYVGAFHDPRPHAIDVLVAGPGAEEAAAALGQLDEEPLEVARASSSARAREAVAEGSTTAALVARADGPDALLVASGGGVSEANAVQEVVSGVEQQRGHEVRTRDLVPLVDGDARGLTGFYLVLGWLVGGYLVSALLGVSQGSRLVGARQVARRLLLLLTYSVASGLAGALLVDRVFDALPGHLLALWGLGTLLVLAGATVTLALQALFGTVGIGLTVLLFVVLGNPSAGGAYQGDLLPGFWRTIGPWLPNGAGTEAVRDIVYLSGDDLGGHVAVVALWALVGALLALAAGRLAAVPSAAVDLDRIDTEQARAEMERVERARAAMPAAGQTRAR